MGFFNKKNRAKSVMDPKTSFEQIAQFMCLFYGVLKRQYSTCYNERQLLCASGLLTCFEYIADKKIEPAELAIDFCFSEMGECSIFPYRFRHVEETHIYLYSPDEKEKLINYVMEVECNIFTYGMAEKRLGSPQEIIKGVISYKKEIMRTVDYMLDIGIKHPSYNEYEEMTMKVMSEDMLGIRSFIESSEHLALTEKTVVSSSLKETTKKVPTCVICGMPLDVVNLVCTGCGKKYIRRKKTLPEKQL